MPVVTVGADDNRPFQWKPDNDNFFSRFQRITGAKAQRSAYRSVRLNDGNVIAAVENLDLAGADIRNPHTFAAVNHVKIGEDRTSIANSKSCSR